MAPEVANQKRKRGRPTNASRDDEDGDASGAQLKLTRQGQLATTSENARDSDMYDSSRPRKRGRRANTEAQLEPEPEATQSSRTRRKRGQSPVAHASGNRDDEREEELEPTDNAQRRKRGRPRMSNGIEQNEEGDNAITANENIHPKKRGRPPKEAEIGKDKEVAAEEADDENEGNSSILRRSGRVRRSPNSPKIVQPAGEQGSSNKKSKEGRKKGRPSLGEQHVGETEQESVPQPKRKRGRPSLNDHPAGDTEINIEPPNQPKKRGRPSLSGENAALSSKEKEKKSRDQPSHDQEAPEEGDRSTRGRPRLSDKGQSEQRKHRRSSDTQNRSSSPDSDASPPRYRHLTTRTRRVPRNVIETKWTPLEASALSSVAAVLQSASRPVLLRLNNAQRHAQAQAALAAVSKRLRSKMARGLPFPPATTAARREEEFDFERTVSGVQALESQLDPLLHGVELLRREKERAEKELEREYKVLGRLSSNARAEARERREQMRKMHVLVQERPPESARTEDGDEIVPAEKGSGRVFSDLQDEELSGVASQIASHMESMRGNLQQMDGVVPAITKSRGLLRAVLQSHLDPEQLENVILG
ncbi:CENP-Q, a CENPA-CAD centromere complex subunit-domain-containing protein [Hypoxylon cercidicola]|nr:CENP-Q, a CENPA-CAD centromere complex subunit-domain-containing protein [Hypoxylon cercidicola]